MRTHSGRSQPTVARRQTDRSAANASPETVAFAAELTSPLEVLTAQRTLGNRAVQRSIQRKPIKEGELDSDLSNTINQARGGGQPLPDRLRGSMESAFQSDFGGVRVHSDQQSDTLNRSVQAKAFTLGNDIYFKKGNYQPGSSSGQELLAHELTHVVQQGGARTRGVQTKLTLGPAGDRYEQEADRVAKQVVSGLNRPTVQRAPRARVQLKAASTLQRKLSLNPLNWFKSDEQIAKEKEKAEKQKTAKEADVKTSLEEASQYERRLGKYVFNHPTANTAAKTVNEKLVSALVPEFKAEDEAQQKIIGQTFGGTGVKYAGNVGQEFADVWGVLQSGNLRERMTATYNAMFGGFKTVFLDLIKRSAWGEAEKRGFDARKLKIRKRQLSGAFHNWGRKKDAYGGADDYDIYRDPRNPLDRKHIGNIESGLLAKKPRYEKPKGEDTITKRKVGELNEGPFKAGLSDREKKFMFSNKDRTADVSDERLSWEEGGSKWDMNDKSAWVQRIKNDLKMPVIAGPSGTALRFFQMWEWLKKPIKSVEWRLALLGWMLVENDHSFHEIMQMGTDYGAPYKAGQDAYKSIDPLTTGELRHNVCVDPKYPGLFPDEVAYHRKLNAGSYKLMAPYKQDMDERTSHAQLIKDQFGMKKGAYDKSGLPQLLKGVTAYTTIAYQIMNIVAGSNPLVAKARIAYMLSKNRKRTTLLDLMAKQQIGVKLTDEENKQYSDEWDAMSFADRNICLVLDYNPDVTASELIEESKEHNKQTAYGLKLLPKFQGTVYRGESNIGMPYKKGKQIKLSKFLSTSRQTGYVTSYAKPGRFLTPIALVIESKTGRDVNAVTVNEDEEVRKGHAAASLDEVVLLPGTTLSVESEPETDARWPGIQAVKLKEVGEAKDENILQQEITGPLVKGTDDEDATPTVTGRLYVTTSDFNGGWMPADFSVSIPTGSVLEVLDDRYPDKVGDPITDWIQCKLGLDTVYVLAYDLSTSAKAQTTGGDVTPVVDDSERVKEENRRKFGHIKGGKYPIKFPAGRKLMVYKDETATDATPLEFSAEQPARLVIYPLGVENGRCRLEFSGKIYYVNITDVFDSSGAVLPEGPKESPKVEAEPPVDDEGDEITRLFSENQLTLMLASNDDLAFVVSMGQVDASELQGLTNEQVVQLAAHIKLKVEDLKKQIQELT